MQNLDTKADKDHSKLYGYIQDSGQKHWILLG